MSCLCITSKCSLQPAFMRVSVIFYTRQLLLCKLVVYCPSVPTRYVQPPVISYDAIFEQSSPHSPIVFILSPGSDPVSDLMKLAERKGFGNRLKFLAMGQGQEKVTSVGGWGCAACSMLVCQLQILLLMLWPVQISFPKVCSIVKGVPLWFRHST